MLVNGKEYDWTNIVINLFGERVTGVSAIKYSDSQEKINNYGAGSKPVSRSYGKYEATGSITLHMSEIEAITNKAPNRRLQDIPPFNVTVSYLEDGAIVTHKLRDCEFLNNARDLKEGLLETELELILSEIEW